MSSDPRPETESTVRAVVRALELLEIVCRADCPLPIQEIAARSDLAIATTHRLLRTLISCGYLDQDIQSRQYKPGLKIFELAHAVTQNLSLIDQARDTLDALSAAFNETVHLAVLDRGEVVYLDKRESKRPLRMYSAVGKRGPAYCTGVGKALLAHLDEDVLEEYLASVQLIPFTEKTLTDPATLRAHLSEVRSRGFAIDDMEHEEGIRCVACPVFDHRQQAVAAISVTVPAYRVSLAELETLIPTVQEQTLAFSKRLGYVTAPGVAAYKAEAIPTR